MSVAWFACKTEAIRIPDERNLGWPIRSIPPHARPPGRGHHGAVVPRGRDAYRLLNPDGSDAYASLKRLSDSEVLTLALLQQLRGTESERSFLRDAQRSFSHLFPGTSGLHPSSLHRRVRKLRRFLEPLRRSVVPELVGEPETPSWSTRRCFRSCTRAG